MAKKKYEHVIGGLPRLPGEPTERQRRVDALAAELGTAPEARPSSLANQYRGLRRLKAAIEDALSAVQERLDAAEAATISALEADNLDSVTFADGASVARGSLPFASVSDRLAFDTWVRASVYAAQMSLPWSTVNAVTKQLLLDGEPLPPGVTVYAKTALSLRGDR